MKDKKIIRWVFKVFLVWRLLTFLAAFLAIRIMPFKPSFPYWESTLMPFGSPLFWSWANFDGVHYLGIAKLGYFAQFTQAFFPLYPLVVRWLNFIFGNLLFTGLLISNFCFFLSLYFLYKLVILDFSHKIAKRVVILLIFFPTSFYFAGFYTESLFLLLILGGFYALRKQKWVSAGFLGVLASLTRLVGVFLVPAFLLEAYQQKKKKGFWPFLFCLLPSLGLLAYMAYLKDKFSDALYFLHAQPFFGASRSDRIVLLYQVFWRYFKMFLTVKDPLVYFNVTLEFIITVIFILLLISAFYKKLRSSYLLFASLAFLAPTLTGTFSSMPRYVLVLFPGFIVLALMKSKKLYYFLILISLLLLIFSTMLFIRGYWVA